MKKFLKLMTIACIFALFSGCRSVNSAAIPNITEPLLLESTGNEQSEIESGREYTLYFPDDPAYSYTHSIGADETIYVREIIKTNTTQIRVTNGGEMAIVCNLYYPDDISEVIQTNTIDPRKSMTFTGLTSRFTYCIGFQTAEDGTVKVSISG